MKKTIFYFVLLTGFMLTTSCSHRLVGTWDLASYETMVQGQQGVALQNIGTMTFNRDGSGETNLNYTVFQVTREEQVPFTWEVKEGLITLSGNAEESDFLKTWIVVDDKRKSQKWRSTDGQNQVQTIRLNKQ